MACTEEELMAVVLNLSYQKGWITENEKLRIKSSRTLNDKKRAMLNLINIMECDDNATKVILSMRCVHEMNTPDLPKGDENRFLAKIMSKLIEKGLVTEEEKLDYELQQLLVEKKIDVQENLPDVNFDDDIPDEMENAIIKNPLKVGVVIKRILQYLTFKEIKESRLISKEWASVGLNVLVDRSKITFNSAVENIHNEPIQRRGPINYFQVFPEHNEENKTIAFSHFKFDNPFCSKVWTIEELNYFFRNQQQHITELEFSDLYLVNDDGKDVDGFDITPWIANSPIAMKNSETNTKLKILVHSFRHSNLSVDSNALSNVKDLELHKCNVNLKDGSRITPINLYIEHPRFTKEESQLAELCINDFVDFCKAKIIYIYTDQYIDSEFETILSLDLSGYHKLERLDLSSVTLINWKTSNWKIDQLELREIPLTDVTEIQIRKLHFEDAEIDVSVLPQSLEELFIHSGRVDRLVATQPIVFHNLKSLALHLKGRGFSAFFQNVKCPNLVRVHISKVVNQFEMDFAWLPSSLKILRLDKIIIKNPESRNFKLDKLVLHDYKFSQLIEICSTHIQTKDLVLVHPWTKNPKDAYLEFSNLLENQKRFQDLGQRIYVNVESKYFLPKVENSRHWADKYFVFESNLGKSIDSDEFDKISLEFDM